MISSHGANWTNITEDVAANNEAPVNAPIGEVHMPHSLRTEFVTCPDPLLLITKDRVYI